VLTAWQKSAVKEHDTSVPHVTAIDYEQRSVMGENYRKQVVNRIPANNPLKQSFALMSEDERELFVRSFEIAYLLAKKARAKTLLRFPGLVRNGKKAWC
jgi:hypothetical protein